MARALSNVKCYIETDKNGSPLSRALWTFHVVDGSAKSKEKNLVDEAADFSKTFHSTGIVGEFWRDGIDAIKTAYNIA